MEDRRENACSMEPAQSKLTSSKKTFSGRGQVKHSVPKRPAAKRVSWQHDSHQGGRGRLQHVPQPRNKPKGAVSLHDGEPEKRKGMSLNHLLNFTIAPRTGGDSGTGLPVMHRKRTGSSAYNKEQFLQANCQFVVRDGGDYSVHVVDPNKLVGWDAVEQVRLFCHQIPSCPICLYPPTVAKITRCGHVYCWSCLLHYLSLGDRKWRKCPICYESIYKDDLKSVNTRSSKQYKPGDTVTLWLMTKQKGSTAVWPKSCLSTSSALPNIDDKIPTQFCKLLVATPQQVLEQIVAKEKADLNMQMKDLTSNEESERCFIQCCLQDLEVREKELICATDVHRTVATFDSVALEIRSQGLSSSPSQVEDFIKDKNYVEGSFEQPFTDSEDDDAQSSSLLESSNSICSHSSSSGDSEELVKEQDYFVSPPMKLPDSNQVYFYQAADGQHLYLHTINAQCLVKEYGTLADAPMEISARIVELEQLSVNEETQSKYRYLSHLPMSCVFMLCELDLKKQLSPDTFRLFSGRLRKRQQFRQMKKQKENKVKLPKDRPLPEECVLGADHRQQLSPENFHNLLSMASSPPLPSNKGASLDPAAMEFVPGLAFHGTESIPLAVEKSTAPSFAQALSKGEKKVEVRSPAVKITTPPKGPRHTAEVQSSDDDSETVPTFQDAFVDALAEASRNIQLDNQGITGRPGGSKTAKKGRKKIVLFSTGMQRKL